MLRIILVSVSSIFSLPQRSDSQYFYDYYEENSELEDSEIIGKIKKTELHSR